MIFMKMIAYNVNSFIVLRSMARSSSPSPAESCAIDEKVAATVRSLRLQQGLSLSALAKAARLSAAYLSRVENHLASLTLQNLAMVAAALNVPVSAFFNEDAMTLPLVVVRAGQGKIQRMKGRKALQMELLAAEKRGKLMEPMAVEFAPEQIPQPLRAHPGEEFNLIISGECRFLYGKEQISLRAGDSVYYDASVPHAVQATGSQSCRLLAVVASRDYLFHGDLSKLLQINCQ